MATSYYERNREACILKANLWQLNNPEKRKEIAKRWSINNRDKKQQYQDRYRKDHPEKYLFNLAKRRALSKGKEFTISLEEIIIPVICPLLGIEINSYSPTNDQRPSIDRIDSSKGYIPGNVWVVSWKANRLKNSATLKELQTMVVNLEKRMAQ